MKLLIEGIKLTGKSSIIKLLNERNRETSIFEYRGHCLLDAPKYTISPKLDEVLKAYAFFLYTLKSVDYLLLRGHIFPFALAKCTNQIINSDFHEIDRLFQNVGVVNILLIVNEDTFKERLEKRIRDGRIVHGWDASWEKMKSLQDCYQEYVAKSIIPSLTIDTGEFDEYTVLNKIIEFQKNYLTS